MCSRKVVDKNGYLWLTGFILNITIYLSIINSYFKNSILSRTTVWRQVISKWQEAKQRALSGTAWGKERNRSKGLPALRCAVSGKEVWPLRINHQL